MKTSLLRSAFLALVMAVLPFLRADSRADDAIRIMALGDSITAGYTDNPDWNVPFGFGYRSGLYTRLTDADYDFQYVGASQEPWNGVFGVPTAVSAPDLRTYNQDFHRGYGGASAATLLPNISSWLKSDAPDVVLLMVGINGIGTNPTAAEENLKSLVQNIVVQRPTAHVIVAQITPYSTYTDSIVQYNSYIKNTLVPYYAGLGKNVTTVNQYANFGTGTSVDASLYSNGVNHPNAAGYDKMAETWYQGIQSLGTVVHSAGPARAVLANGGFESPQYGDATHNINPADANWTCTTGSTGAGSGIEHGNPYGGLASNSTPSSGTQMGFLQGAGAGYGTTSFLQNMTGLIVGRTYTLSFSAKGIAGFSGTNPFSVSVNDATIATGLSPAAASYYTTYTATFVATSSSMPLRFFDAGNVPVGKVTWIDNIKLGISTPAASNLVANGNFDATAVTPNTHSVNPAGTGWRFTVGSTGAGSGIDCGNPYGASICPNSESYQGPNRAFLQGQGEGYGASSIEQDVAGFVVGKSYVLTFEAAGIEGFSGANPFSASVGGNAVTIGGSTNVSPSGSYELFCSDPFVATSSMMTLRFYDAGNNPVGYVSFIDDVQITAVPEPATGVLAIGLAIAASLVWPWRLARRTRTAS